jgi:hypothetical protein
MLCGLHAQYFVPFGDCVPFGDVESERSGKKAGRGARCLSSWPSPVGCQLPAEKQKMPIREDRVQVALVARLDAVLHCIPTPLVEALV